ncbi:MAG: ATP-binding protein [Chitinophagaceae bacterium]|nr:ATP-binding protein [Chitinophagaceae bacterium]
MINNSKKHKASELTITTESFPNRFEIIFRDNGIGFNKDIADINDVFKQGYSTTKSTGLGLYHINNIIKGYKWSITANTTYKKGAEFVITIKK